MQGTCFFFLKITYLGQGLLLLLHGGINALSNNHEKSLPYFNLHFRVYHIPVLPGAASKILSNQLVDGHEMEQSAGNGVWQ